MNPDLLARYRVLRVLITLVTVIVAIYTVQLVWTSLVTFGDIILLFFLAWIIAFILDPLSTYLRNLGIPRPLAVSLIYLALAIVISGVIVLTVPIIGDQIRRLAEELTIAFSPSNLDQVSANMTRALQRLGFRQRDAAHIVSVVGGQIPGYAASIANQAVNVATTTITSILTLLFDAFLVIILSFYLMLDGERFITGIVRRLPPKWSDDAQMIEDAVTQIFGGFLRAQLVVGLIYTALTWLALALLGQANSLPIALVCGLLMLLPFIGAVLAVAPPVALVLLQTPSDQVVAKLVILLIALIVAQQITLQVIAPRIFGSTMGIHPLLLFAGLLIGAKVGGVWGAFFAGPAAAILYSMFEVFYDRYQQSSPLFPNKPPRRQPDNHSAPSVAAPVAPDLSSSAPSQRMSLNADSADTQPHQAEATSLRD